MSIHAFEKLSEEQRTRILDACLAEFASKGFEGASTNRIVAKLGIPKGSIFYWFGTKEELYLRLVDRSMGRFLRLFTPGAQSWPREILARLRVMIDSSLAFLEEHTDDYRLFASFMEGDARHLFERYMSERFPEALAAWAAWFDGVDTSDFRSSPQEVQRLLMWVLGGLKMETMAVAENRESAARLRSELSGRLDSMMGLLAHAIYRHPERTSPTEPRTDERMGRQDATRSTP